ncbi:MAG TPA: FAD-dependent oxidoreductase, partial [Nevskiaceae bacterium]|nr:FAD-dependent oxidoreductase [Nevskiaceae bacterium]
DAHRWCLGLRSALERRGVKFTFGCEVRRIVAGRGAVRGVETSAGLIDAAHIVLAAAAWSPQLAAPLGIKLAIRPAKGYSLSVPMRGAARMPLMAIIDDSQHTSATPLGAVLRLAGTAEFCGFDFSLRPERLHNLWRYLRALGPSLEADADRQRAVAWCGLRPMAADGRPYIGATPVAGLWLNCGHGHLGWTQGAGSGRLLAQLISGAATAIDPGPYALARGR